MQNCTQLKQSQRKLSFSFLTPHSTFMHFYELLFKQLNVLHACRLEGIGEVRFKSSDCNPTVLRETSAFFCFLCCSHKRKTIFSLFIKNQFTQMAFPKIRYLLKHLAAKVAVLFETRILLVEVFFLNK